MSDKIKISAETYSNNLDFYTLSKLLLQSKSTDKQLIILQKTVSECKKMDELAEYIMQAGFTKLDYILAAFSHLDGVKLAAYIDTAIDLLLIKDLVLKEAKVYAAQEFKKEIREISDLLSIEYDVSGTHLPYGQRVISALMVYALTNTNRDSSFVISASEDRTKEFAVKCKNLADKFSLNLNSMFQIIMDESVNQSIKADAGVGYESRVSQALMPIVGDLLGHAHDSKIQAVEYDNRFTYNGKKCGISAKRTLRERYKQNLEHTDLLDVDYMFVITLGLDLNETTMNNILSKNGNYIIVSKEQYELKAFLQNNDKIIPSDKIKQYFDKIIK